MFGGYFEGCVLENVLVFRFAPCQQSGIKSSDFLGRPVGPFLKIWIGRLSRKIGIAGGGCGLFF